MVKRAYWPLLLSLGLLVAGCNTDMWVQPRAEIQGESDIFENRMASRPPVTGAVARGQATEDPVYETGFDGTKLVKNIPSAKAMTALSLKSYKDFILRGKERFEVFCMHCHGQLGDGNGMIAKRGLDVKRKVATYHTDRVRKMPDGYFFNVITHGHGVMFSFAARVPIEDRWAITAYIRALQRSQAPNAAAAAKVVKP